VENGCVRVKPLLIWNRAGILVRSCEECSIEHCKHRSLLHPPEPTPIVWVPSKFKPRKTEARAHSVPEHKAVYHGMQCRHCGSLHTVKIGFYKGKKSKRQVRRCHDCGRKFVEALEEPRTPVDIVKFALRQVSLGQSLRAVSSLLLDKYGIKRSGMAILNWTKKKPRHLCWRHGHYLGGSGCPKCRKTRKRKK
jgi:transposase-like protein